MPTIPPLCCSNLVGWNYPYFGQMMFFEYIALFIPPSDFSKHIVHLKCGYIILLYLSTDLILYFVLHFLNCCDKIIIIVIVVCSAFPTNSKEIGSDKPFKAYFSHSGILPYLKCLTFYSVSTVSWEGRRWRTNSLKKNQFPDKLRAAQIFGDVCSTDS